MDFVTLLITSVLFIVGCLLLFIGVRRYRKPRDYHQTEGKIVPKKGLQAFNKKPRIQYEVNGFTYTYQSPITQNSGLQYGKKVTVLYNPNNPSDCIIDNFAQRGSRTILFGTILILATFIFVLIMLGNPFKA